MPATLSSTFDIVFDGPTLLSADANANEVTMSVGNLGRGSFIVEEMSATGVNNGVATLDRIDPATGPVAGDVAVCTITAALTVPGVVTTTNQVVFPGQNLRVTATVQNISRFVIRCRTVGTPVPHVTV